MPYYQRFTQFFCIKQIIKYNREPNICENEVTFNYNTYWVELSIILVILHKYARYKEYIKLTTVTFLPTSGWIHVSSTTHYRTTGGNLFLSSQTQVVITSIKRELFSPLENGTLLPESLLVTWWHGAVSALLFWHPAGYQQAEGSGTLIMIRTHALF